MIALLLEITARKTIERALAQDSTGIVDAPRRYAVGATGQRERFPSPVHGFCEL
jgi:hypothetical protein